LKEYSFEHAKALLRDRKCKGIKHKTWGKADDVLVFRADGELYWLGAEWYNTDYFVDWREFGWILIEPNFNEEEEQVVKAECTYPLTVITQYIYRNRNGNRAKAGLLVAFNNGNKDTVKFGYSVCAKSDKFDKDKAWSIAMGRAEKGSGNAYPPSIAKDVRAFKGRVEKYFKGCSNDISETPVKELKLSEIFNRVEGWYY